MTGKEFAAKCKAVATNYTTCYVWGTFGWPCTEALIQRNIKQYPSNESKYAAKARSIIGKGWMFDCVGLIKAVLWGWDGNRSHNYGGANYASNNVPDVSANGMIALCKNVSMNFSTIEVGEAVWLSGHIGVYIGDGLVVECTPSFKGGVQITALKNIGTKAGFSSRKWTKHGKLPWITYDGKTTTEAKSEASAGNVSASPKSKDAIAAKGVKFTTTASSLNVRKTPTSSISSNIICQIPKGTIVWWYGYYTGDWYYVQLPNKSVGYVHKSYLKKA